MLDKSGIIRRMALADAKAQKELNQIFPKHMN